MLKKIAVLSLIITFPLFGFTSIEGNSLESAESFDSTAVIEENPLASYEAIVEKFNETYGTNYQIASQEQLECIGRSVEENIQFLTSMSEEEFWDYLYDAHLNYISNPIDLGEVVTEENEEAVTEEPTVFDQSIEESYSCELMPYYEFEETGIQRYEVPLEVESCDEKNFEEYNFVGNYRSDDDK